MKLRRVLGTQVSIHPLKPGAPGRVEIEYYNLSDLDRIYQVITTEQDARAAANTP